MDLNLALSQVTTFIKQSGDLALRNWNNLDTIRHEDGIDVTTNTDKEIERNFAEFVDKNFPTTGFKGEEFEELNKESEFMWQIDPIDGTKFYAQGIPFWTNTIALTHNNEPIIGLVYNPVSKQLYTAIKGQGAFLNGKQIKISEETNINKIQISLDLALNSKDIASRNEFITPMLESLYTSAYRVRSLGAGAISLAWLSQGFFGAYVSPYRPSNKFVDIFGGLIIAQEAGAYVYKEQIKGEENLYNFIVGKQSVVEELIPILSKLNHSKSL